MDVYQKRQIHKEFKDCVFRTLERIKSQDTNRPFHKALLTEKALVWSRFERSFSTSFGQGAIERISLIAAVVGGADNATRQKETYVHLPQDLLSAIEDHLTDLRSSRGKHPGQFVDTVNALKGKNAGRDRRIRVISDLWWSKAGIDHYMSIKTVKPNIDQTAEAKKDILKLKLNDQDCSVHFGLYYNPYGEKKSDYAWPPPQGIFDFATDPVILIGKDYWDTLGGDGFYEEILEIAEEVGLEAATAIEKLDTP